MGWLHFIAAGAITLALAGCQLIETGQKVIEVIKDPDVQVGDDSTQPSTADVTFFAQRNANLNLFGEAVPISILVLQMRGEAGLGQADIVEVMDDAQATVGKDYISSSEHSIPPGEFLSLDPIELSEETGYLGFVALFADAGGATWQVAKSVEPVGKAYTVTVEVAAKALRVDVGEQ